MRSRIAHESSITPSAATTVGKWMGRAALGLVLATVMGRSTVMEYLRDPFPVTVGSTSSGRAPGPGTALAMDLLAALPALIVLARAAIDRSFSHRKSWANVLMAALAVWLALSVFRADDRFAAAVDAANLCAAFSLLWATQQLVRSWRTLRIVAAVAFGLLLIYAAHGVIDRFVELPLRQENLTQHLPEMLKTMNIDPGSYEAQRLQMKVTNGELLGFSGSINTFAAMIVVAAIVAAGAAIQRRKDHEEPAVAIVIFGLIAACIIVLRWTDSRTAYATPVIAAMLFAVIWLLGDWLDAHRKVALALVLFLIALGTATLVSVGIAKGKLYQDSLNFRWRYWVGAWGVWRERPWIGVGWDSFNLHYLAHRLPIASEEPKDPHNFIVRAFCEFGIVGGVLTLLATGRALWEMTWPTRLPVSVEGKQTAEQRISDLGRLTLICSAGMVLAALITIDFSQLNLEAAIEILKRLLYGCLAVIGGAMVMLRSMKDQRIEDRPAPWLRAGMTIAVMIFLIHNLIDFSMFESSAMFFAAMLAGASWGVGLPERPAESKALAISRLAVAAMIWLAVAAAVAAPTILSESAAGDGDDLLRASRVELAAKRYKEAADLWPGNADYPFRAAMALASGDRADSREVEPLLNAAVAANPMNPRYYRVRAEFASAQKSPNTQAIRADYESALRIDPNNVDIRLEFAEALARLGDHAEAKRQYELALSYNDQLDPQESKRLSAKRLAEIHATMQKMKMQ